MEKIKSISEAFSMQPLLLPVLTENQLNANYDKSDSAKEIKKEVVRIDGEPTEVYVGYNPDGKKIFQYLAKSVNVHYQPESINTK